MNHVSKPHVVFGARYLTCKVLQCTRNQSAKNPHVGMKTFSIQFFRMRTNYLWRCICMIFYNLEILQQTHMWVSDIIKMSLNPQNVRYLGIKLLTCEQLHTPAKHTFKTHIWAFVHKWENWKYKKKNSHVSIWGPTHVSHPNCLSPPFLSSHISSDVILLLCPI